MAAPARQVASGQRGSPISATRALPSAAFLTTNNLLLLVASLRSTKREYILVMSSSSLGPESDKHFLIINDSFSRSACILNLVGNLIYPFNRQFHLLQSLELILPHKESKRRSG